MFINWINCILEFAIYLLFFLCTASKHPKYRFIFLYLFIVGVISYDYFIRNSTYVFVLNMGLFTLLICTTIPLHRIFHRITYALASFLLLLILQFIAYSFLPATFLRSNLGNLIANSLITILALGVYLFVSSTHLSEKIAAFILKFRIPVVLILILFLILGQVYLSGTSKIWHLLPGIISLLTLFLIVVAIIIYIQYQRSTDRLRAEILSRNMENAQAMVDAMRIQIHDFKHHLQHLEDSVLHAEDLASLQQSVSSYIADFSYDRSIYAILIAIDQPILRSSLFGCYDRCLKKDIHFSLDASALIPVFPLKDYQLVEVLENLLMNAIEHNEQLPAADRYIHVTLSVADRTHTISVENPSTNTEGALEELYLAGRTTKHGTHQGLGLASITQILSSSGMKLNGLRDIANNRMIFSITYESGGDHS